MELLVLILAAILLVPVMSYALDAALRRFAPRLVRRREL
jgi:hypothetical protein